MCSIGKKRIPIFGEKWYQIQRFQLRKCLPDVESCWFSHENSSAWKRKKQFFSYVKKTCSVDPVLASFISTMCLLKSPWAVKSFAANGNTGLFCNYLFFRNQLCEHFLPCLDRNQTFDFELCLATEPQSVKLTESRNRSNICMKSVSLSEKGVACRILNNLGDLCCLLYILKTGCVHTSKVPVITSLCQLYILQYSIYIHQHIEDESLRTFS